MSVTQFRAHFQKAEDDVGRAVGGNFHASVAGAGRNNRCMITNEDCILNKSGSRRGGGSTMVTLRKRRPARAVAGEAAGGRRGAAAAWARSPDETDPDGGRPAPGGGTDIVGRLVANKLAEGFSQPVVVANVTGASGAIAAQQVATATPDGYRILFASSAHTMNAALRTDLPYDAVKSFAPVTKIADTLNLIVVHPSLGVATLRDLIALAKKQPGKLNYGSGGIGTNAHMSTELRHGRYRPPTSKGWSAPAGDARQRGPGRFRHAADHAAPHPRGRLKGLARRPCAAPACCPTWTADEAGVRGYEQRLVRPAHARRDAGDHQAAARPGGRSPR
jgi:hypothetical protein